MTTPKSEVALLACRCGGEVGISVNFRDGLPLYYIVCATTSCCVAMESFDEAKLIAAWNTRTPQPSAEPATGDSWAHLTTRQRVECLWVWSRNGLTAPVERRMSNVQALADEWLKELDAEPPAEPAPAEDERAEFEKWWTRFRAERLTGIHKHDALVGWNARAALSTARASRQDETLTTCDGWTVAFNAYSAGTGYGAKHPDATIDQLIAECSRYATAIFPHEVCDSGEKFDAPEHADTRASRSTQEPDVEAIRGVVSTMRESFVLANLTGATLKAEAAQMWADEIDRALNPSTKGDSR